MKYFVSRSIVLLLLSILIFACEKDEILPGELNPNSPPSAVEKSLSSKGGTKYPDKVSPAFELKMDIAEGISLAIQENPELITLLARQKSGKNKRFKALPIINFLDKKVGSKGMSLADALLQTKSELPEKYFNTSDLRKEILKTDPLISLKIPSVWFDYDFVRKKAQPLVIAFENTGEEMAYVNGRPFDMKEGKNYFSINVVSSEEHVITEIDENIGDDTPYSNLFSCQEVQNHVNSIIRNDNSMIVEAASPYQDGHFVVIDIIEDVRDVYTVNCLVPPSNPPPSSTNCDLICPRDCAPQDNRIMNFRPANMASLLEMGSNAPSGQMEELFNFRMTTITGNRTDNLASSFTQNFMFLFDEVVESIVTVTTGEEVCERVWNSHWGEWEEDCYTPTFSEVTVNLRTIEFRDGVGIPLFGFNNLPQNTWSFDSYGTALMIDWAEVDNIFYNNGGVVGTTTQNSYSTQVSFGATFGIPLPPYGNLGLSGGLTHGWQSSTSRTAQTTLTYSAAARTELGQILVGYCDAPNTEGEEPNHTTGSIEAQLSYFLWE